MPTPIAVNDPNWFFSPYNTFISGSAYVLTNAPGWYTKASFGGTTVGLTVDTGPNVAASVLAANYPSIKYSIDGGAFTTYQVQSSDTTIALASGLSNTTHTLLCYHAGVAWSSNDRWTTPSNILKITGLVLDTGQSLSPQTLRPRRILVYGDSNLAGEEALASGVSVAHQDAAVSFAQLLSASGNLNGEVGVLGYSGQGYEQGGGGNVPQLSAAWDHYFSGQSRLSGGLFSPAPDYILCNHGINGSTVASDVTTMIANFRAAAPNALISMIVPWNGSAAAAIQTGVTNAADSKAYYINTGTTTYDSHSSPHLSTLGHSQYAGDIFPLLTLAPNVGVSRSRLMVGV